ncbi:hypothetical protein MMC13_001434, partial [Lambiella insularis]|nr:hypothetical protein [Lambiella insularis]
MPRLQNLFLRSARNIDPLLVPLLRSCRDLPSARSELRWLREHVRIESSVRGSKRRRRSILYQLCLERSSGKPLQYILGNQPFGNLDILCRPGVLIPRPETEAYIARLALTLVKNTQSTPIKRLRVLDLCTGSGCIALLLHAILAPHIADLRIEGVDISLQALALARENLTWNIKKGHLQPRASRQVQFMQGDVLSEEVDIRGGWDLLVSNPPYISPFSFDCGTERSVRNFEPKLALVPPGPRLAAGQFSGQYLEAAADTFYYPLATLTRKISASIMLLEVAGTEQALRVANMVSSSPDTLWEGCEVWHDNHDGTFSPQQT